MKTVNVSLTAEELRFAIFLSDMWIANPKQSPFEFREPTKLCSKLYEAEAEINHG